MRSTVRQISVILLLAVLLAPGLVQARTTVRHGAQSSPTVSTPARADVFSLSSVWNLLTNLIMKTGPTLDPSGGTGSGGTGSASTNGDTGPTLDPSGAPGGTK